MTARSAKQPEATEVIDAASRHRRKHHSELHDWMANQAESDESSRRVPPAMIQRVRVLGEHPEPVWLWSCVYVPKDVASRGGEWRALSPFGKHDDPDFRKRVERRCESNDALAGQIEKLSDRVDDEELEEYGVMMGLVEDRARRQLEEKFGNAVGELEVYDVMLPVARSFAELDLIASDRFADKADDVLVKCQQALEKASHLVNERLPPGGQVEQLAALDGGANGAYGELLNRMARTCGFVTPIPHGLRAQSHGKVDLGRSLRAKVVRMLLGTDRPEHPLRQAGYKEPSLLEGIDRVADLRNPAAHWSPEGEQAGRKDVEECVKTVYRTVELLFET